MKEEPHVSHARYRLHDGPLLRRLMDSPPVGGRVYSVRSLALATDLSYSKIQKMVTEDRPTCTPDEAERIACALSLSRKALFSPISSASADKDEEDTDGPR